MRSVVFLHRARSAIALLVGGGLMPYAFSCASFQEAVQRRSRIGTQCIANFYELDYVDAALSTFDLGDESLRIVEALTQLNLRYAGPLAQVAKQGQERTIVAVVGRAGHEVAVVRQRTLESDSE